MKYLKEYKDFYSSIKDPLEKLDEVQVELDGLEIASDQINGNYELGGIPEEDYKSLIKELNSFFEWGKEEISILESECRDQIKKRKKKAWQGHDRLPFPVVWNRKSYNKVEPEIKSKGRKNKWIEWLLTNITEGEDDYWQYEDNNTVYCLVFVGNQIQNPKTRDQCPPIHKYDHQKYPSPNRACCVKI